jgi:hypothetical protein
MDARNKNEREEEDDDDFWFWQGSCGFGCADPSCGRGPLLFRRRREMARATAGKTKVGEEVMRGNGAAQAQERLRLVRGQAVWLLPAGGGSDSELDWFQGYMFLSDRGCTFSTSSTAPSADSPLNRQGNGKLDTPLGLLAQNQEVDECLACADGGYRRLNLSLFDWNHGAGRESRGGRVDGKNLGIINRDKAQVPRREDLGEADWTGGDMMHLAGPNVRMRPTRLLTGRSAVPYVTGLFAPLWDRIVASAAGAVPAAAAAAASTPHRERDPSDLLDNEDANSNCWDAPDSSRTPGVLDVLPDVAVVLGDMEVILDAD